MSVPMPGAQAALLEGGRKLHLHHGPIDLLITIEGTPDAACRSLGFAAAHRRFQGLLQELVAELAWLRSPFTAESPGPDGVIARRMAAACAPYRDRVFVTPMAAVAGAVADEVAASILAALGPRAQPAGTPRLALQKVIVNNGGDIAFYAGPGAALRALIASPRGRSLGHIVLPPGPDGRLGLATSGWGGRSFSLGIADSVTVLAPSAAAADVAATLIANAVDLPGHPGIRRAPAKDLAPDSDLGARLVVTEVGPLSNAVAGTALDLGRACAEKLQSRGLILAAALFLQDEVRLVGTWPRAEAPALPSAR